MPPTGFTKNTAKVKVESVTAIVAALLVLFVAMMDPYVSVGIAATLLVALGTCEFVKRHKQEMGI